jgi:uncharacterized protein YciI
VARPLFIILLKFAENRDQASRFMEEHSAWIRRGFADGVFTLLGSLQPQLGGGILAQGGSLEQIRARVAEDPFVAHGVVTAEILQLEPSRADERLAFMLDRGDAP